jgi:periplasmic protein TonB
LLTRFCRHRRGVFIRNSSAVEEKTMFAGLEPIREYAGRRWTAAASFTVQAAIVAAALVIPLLSPQGLPEALVRRRIFLPMPQGEAQMKPAQSGHTGAIAPVTPLLVNRGTSVRFTYPGLHSTEVGPPTLTLPAGGGGGPHGVFDSIANEVVRPVLPLPAVTRPLRVSVMMQGNLLHRVEPEYPAIAKQAGIQGTVVIRAFISREGTIERTQLLSGHPLLAHAALDAVRRWRYRPYYLNGEPVEVETQITVNFVLNR